MADFCPGLRNSALLTLAFRLIPYATHGKAGITIPTRLDAKRSALTARKMPQMRLHVRAMVRDGRHAFLGSQSLRALELDARREVGLIFREPKVVGRLAQIFHDDWALTNDAVRSSLPKSVRADKVAKKVAKAVAEDLPSLAPVLNGAVKGLAGRNSAPEFDVKRVEQTVKDAVKDVVKAVVSDAVEQVVGQNGGKPK